MASGGPSDEELKRGNQLIRVSSSSQGEWKDLVYIEYPGVMLYGT